MTVMRWDAYLCQKLPEGFFCTQTKKAETPTGDEVKENKKSGPHTTHSQAQWPHLKTIETKAKAIAKGFDELYTHEKGLSEKPANFTALSEGERLECISAQKERLTFVTTKVKGLWKQIELLETHLVVNSSEGSQSADAFKEHFPAARFTIRQECVKLRLVLLHKLNFLANEKDLRPEDRAWCELAKKHQVTIKETLASLPRDDAQGALVKASELLEELGKQIATERVEKLADVETGPFAGLKRLFS